MSSITEIKNRVFVVTGTSRGVGLAICRTLHTRGAKFAMLARTEAEIADHAREFGEQAIAIRCDVADRDSAFAAIARTRDHFGGIDGLINNAGMSKLAPVEQVTEADLMLLMRVNVLGPLNMIQAVLPALRARGGGNIVNISSTTVRVPEEFPYLGAYSASKAALERLTTELRIEVSADNIAVTLFSLGSTLTHFGVGWDPDMSAAAFAEWERRSGAAPLTMDPALPAEAIVRCLEAPHGACAEFIQFRPYLEADKGRKMAG